MPAHTGEHPIGGCSIDIARHTLTKRPGGLPGPRCGAAVAGAAEVGRPVGKCAPSRAVEPAQRLGVVLQPASGQGVPAADRAITVKSELLQRGGHIVVRELTGGLYFWPAKAGPMIDGRERAIDTLEYLTMKSGASQRWPSGLPRAAQKVNRSTKPTCWSLPAVASGGQPGSRRLPDVELEHMLVGHRASAW